MFPFLVQRFYIPCSYFDRCSFFDFLFDVISIFAMIMGWRSGGSHRRMRVPIGRGSRQNTWLDSLCDGSVKGGCRFLPWPCKSPIMTHWGYVGRTAEGIHGATGQWERLLAMYANFFQLNYHSWAHIALCPRVSDPSDPPLLSTVRWSYSSMRGGHPHSHQLLYGSPSSALAS